MGIQHLEVTTLRQGLEQTHTLFDGVFWAAQGVEHSAAIWLSARWLHEGDFEKAFRSLLDEVGIPTGFKLVGNPKIIAEIRSWLKEKRYTVLSQAHREGAFELRFRPKDCKLFVARKIKVLVVDDSKTIRNLLTKILSSDPNLEVVGAAESPSVARGMIQTLKPEVITLDLEMPEMNGIDFLKSYLPIYPIPTVMVTSISKEEGPKVLQALEAGAVDYIQKPSAHEIPEITPILIEKIKAAAVARVNHPGRKSSIRPILSGSLDQSCLVAIGSSTGGTEALRKVLTQLPEAIPPIVITQHIPAVFSRAFAERMNSLCAFTVVEGEDGMEVLPGRVYIAPGGKQMRIRQRPNGRMVIGVDDSAPVNRHKPSVDYLFDSVAEVCKGNCIGVILTGMGGDGAHGLLKLKMLGARTIAQDEASCAVFGMPREAIRLGAASEILDLEQIPAKIVTWLSQKKAA